ncbi:MAG: hypothetical protein JXQ67_04105 [Campylobacterales bacterium]|nr:hypothetical protein [Campylobacterales bacterium]
MKISISRQHIYLLFFSFVLFMFVVLFSFALLIPEGKEYRVKRAQMIKELKELRKYQDFSDETFATLKELQSENRHVISALDRVFDIERFQKSHSSYFNSLNITKIEPLEPEDGFSVYEVNTSSKISTPTTFYEFLDSINKSDWIIDVTFPIEFKREADLIKSSFTMKVYHNSVESNSTASESVDK